VIGRWDWTGMIRLTVFSGFFLYATRMRYSKGESKMWIQSQESSGVQEKVFLLSVEGF
jgi:hypothetical protein